MPDIGERRLATIRRVSKIEPIPGADRIVKATIDGWELVTQKENYKPGDLCLYFEIDAFLPVREEFEFLRKGCFKSTTNLGDGFRIKTIKLKGQVSQGLSLPLSDFFDYNNQDCNWYKRDGSVDYLQEGDDLTEYFGVQKYEKPIGGPGGSRLGPMNARGHFPSFLQKTDQERVQNCLGKVKKWIYYGEPQTVEVTDDITLENLEAGIIENSEHSYYFKSGDQWFHKLWLRNPDEVITERQVFEVTMKLDGSSVTVYNNEYEYGVCSRNYSLHRDAESVFWRAASLILGDIVWAGKNVAIQGELMGPGVQGNREEFKDNSVFVFDVYDINNGRYMTPNERHEYIDKLGPSINTVPDIDYRFVLEEEVTVQDLLEMADRGSIRHPISEGLVFKSHVVGGPSFKVINNTFLLKEKD